MPDDYKDPVCGMIIAGSKARLDQFHGLTYGFCSEACRNKFQADPSGYVPE